MRHSIRNYKDNKQIPSRFCDVIIENGRADLEVKNSKKELIRIAWEDVKEQVDAAIRESTIKE
jgi:hypothetical protein